jgi:ribonuclease P protein component
LIRRIRQRHAFERLARDGTRIRRSSLWCTWCPEPDSEATSVAFALSRALGPAVTRNLLRRRLRELLREADRQQQLPPAILLIGARTGAVELTFEQLRTELNSLIGDLRTACSP